ncbi:hypothetical protein Avbf_16644 [Armadillidium vulgare]|nr:hypothetical protein Avbf_16644 [Armadillidium vulgare]
MEFALQRIAMLLCLQYPFFSWILNSSLMGMITFICLLSLAFVHPFHLFFDVYLKRVVEQRMKSKVKKNDEPNHNESTDF